MYPHERSLVQRLENKPFALLGINSDEDRDQIKKVVIKEKITWRNWWDRTTDGPIATAWDISGWPTLYLVDHKGVIRYIDPTGKELDDAIDKLLTELSSEKK